MRSSRVGFLFCCEVRTPYKLEGNCVVKSDTGERVPGGCHDTHEKALAHLRALYANVEDVKTKDVSADASPNGLHGPNSLLGIEGVRGRKREKKETKMADDSHSGYLVEADGEQHLPTRKNGKLDHGLMGAAWAALHGGYRGNTYQGPNKSEAIAKLRKLYAEENLPTPDESKTRTKGYDEHGSLTVIADAKGNPRWILRSSSGFRDRDGELITTKALADDCERMNATGKFGPLRWWHVGSKSDTPERGLDIGDCDLSMMSGHTRVESGTFRHPVFARAVKEHVAKLGGSLGFRYPATQPDATKTITHVRTFERSVLPKENVSNLMALKQRLFGKQEDAMDEAQQIAKLKELVGAENHALVDSFLASAKKDEGTLAAMNVDVKAKKDEPETPAEEAKETPMDEKKEDAMDAKKTKEIDADAIADAIMLKMQNAFVTPAQLDAKFAELTTVATKSADEQKVALKAIEDKFASLDTRMKTLEGDTPTSKVGYKASEAAGTSILKSMFSQLADQQGLDLAALGVKSATRPQTEMERIAERMASEWKQNGTAPVA